MDKSLLARLAGRHEFYLGLLVLLLAIGLSAGTDEFLTLGNLTDVATSYAILGILACGLFVVLIAGGIDISFPAVTAIAQYVMASWVIQHGGSFPLAFALAIGVGLLLGLVNGFLVYWLKVAAIIITIATLNLFYGLLVAVAIGALNGALVAWIGVSPILASLGTMTLITGLNILLSNGAVISGFPAAIQFLGNGAVLGVPVALILFLLVAVGLWLLLEHTTLGRSLYLIGSNEQATRFSGVNTARVQIAVYILSALLGWGAALLMMAKFNSAKAGYGESYLLVTILASVLGGINPDGGFGRILGLVLALIVLQMLESGLNLLGVSSYLTMALWGGVLILFIALQNRKA